MLFLVLCLTGIAAGVLGGLLGLGGGVILVPAMLSMHHWFSGADPITSQTAVGTSLVLIILSAITSTLNYHKQKKIHYPIAGLFAIGVIPGVITGSWLNETMDGTYFELYYGLLLVFLFFVLAFRSRLTAFKMDNRGTNLNFLHLAAAFLVSYAVGLISGLFGIGGGALMVPAMIVFLSFPPQKAAATSMVVILLSSIVGSGTHFYYGNINWFYVLSIAPGSLIGGWLGAAVSKKIGGPRVEGLFRLTLLLIAASMFYRFFSS